MAKIMLVEDDNSLREIYEARLAAEGYTVVAARDGEEALAMALKERPDLIIADVMMPKVSGFDMLDILRSTPETKNTKIIMMTALSQAEDKARAEKLGADRYLVKSQVTLEDVTREAHTILDELEHQAATTVAKIESTPATPAPAPVPTPAPEPTTPATPKSTTIPVVIADDDTSDNTPAPTEPIAEKKLETVAKELSTPVKQEKTDVKEQVDEFIAANPTLSNSPEPKSTPETQQESASAAVDSLTKPVDDKKTEDTDDSSRGYVSQASDNDKPSESLAHTKTITPTPDSERTDAKASLDELLAKEGESLGDDTTPAVNSVITPNNT